MPTETTFSHLDADGNARMVNVNAKPIIRRVALASGRICCHPKTISALKEKSLAKGDALTVAKIAAIQGAKESSRLIPLCHPLPIDSIDIAFTLTESAVEIQASVEATAKTGVEMEALTAVSVAALNIYDMCKKIDTSMCIEGIKLLKKDKYENC